RDPQRLHARERDRVPARWPLARRLHVVHHRAAGPEVPGADDRRHPRHRAASSRRRAEDRVTRRAAVLLVLAALTAITAVWPAGAYGAEPTTTSAQGLALIKHFEGFPNGGCPYRDPVGIWTRGYGRI